MRFHHQNQLAEREKSASGSSNLELVIVYHHFFTEQINVILMTSSYLVLSRLPPEKYSRKLIFNLILIIRSVIYKLIGFQNKSPDKTSTFSPLITYDPFEASPLFGTRLCYNSIDLMEHNGRYIVTLIYCIHH
jgi:hypothetical protein